MFKTVNNGKMPTRGSKFSACVDLYANEDITIGVGETAIVPLGVAIDQDELELMFKRRTPELNAFMSSHYMLLEPRSSLRAKGITAGSGIIDIDYPDEVKLIAHNQSSSAFNIKKGDRIAQITLLEHKSFMFGIISESERTGGVGSTGKNWD